jgi:hypothetical protein
LAKTLGTDECLRVLDLSFNQIPEDVMKEELFESVKSANKIITNLDLRGNPGYSSSIRKLFGPCLMRNYNKMISAKPQIRIVGKNWFNKAVLTGYSTNDEEKEETDEEPVQTPHTNRKSGRSSSRKRP